MIVFLSVLLVLLVLVIGAALFNRYLPRWFCDKLAWHMQGTELAFDGCSMQSVCPRCGKQVMQDSQGNWF